MITVNVIIHLMLSDSQNIRLIFALALSDNIKRLLLYYIFLVAAIAHVRLVYYGYCGIQRIIFTILKRIVKVRVPSL